MFYLPVFLLVRFCIFSRNGFYSPLYLVIISKVFFNNAFSFYRDQSSLTWFTACNNFNGVEFFESSNFQFFNFEVCLAGLEDMRLFYDERHKIFMVLDSNYKVENHHYPMSMNMIGNQATKQFEKARIFCSKGNLNSEWSHVRIGTDETLLDLMELYSHTCTREVSLIVYPDFVPGALHIFFDVLKFFAPFLTFFI